MTYGPMIPIAFPIAAISFFVEYWVDKYILLRRNCQPPIIGKNLVNTISRFIPIGVFLNCLFSMIFHLHYNSETLVASLTGLIFSFVFLLTPWERVLKLRKILRSAILKERMRLSQLGPLSKWYFRLENYHPTPTTRILKWHMHTIFGLKVWRLSFQENYTSQAWAEIII